MFNLSLKDNILSFSALLSSSVLSEKDPLYSDSIKELFDKLP